MHPKAVVFFLHQFINHFISEILGDSFLASLPACGIVSGFSAIPRDP